MMENFDVEKEANEIYAKEFLPDELRDYEEKYDEIMRIICKHCPECTTECPIGHSVWNFVKGEL